MSNDTQHRGREWLKRLALMVGGPVLLLCVLELLFWALNVAPLPPDASDFDEATVEKRLGAPGADGRVVCLGGSTMAGEPFDYDVSMCNMVGEAIGSDTTVVNLAGRGLDSSQVLTLATIACRHPQTLVLVYTGHNEFLQLEHFHRGAPPHWVSSLNQSLRAFRVYRWIAGLASAGPPESIGGVGESEVSDDAVYRRFEDNIHGVINACRDQPLMLSTVVSNASFRFPRPGRTLRESVREGPDASEDTWQFRMRAAPVINDALRRIAKETRAVLVDAEPVIHGQDPYAVFWDHVHIKPRIHRGIAQRMMDEAARQSWIGTAGSPHFSLDSTRLSEARLERARYSASMDPVWALGLLTRATDVRDRVGRAVGRVVTTFLADGRTALPARMRELEQALDQAGERERVRWSACATDAPHGETGGCPSSCMPWCFPAVMSPEERSEFLETIQSSAHALAPAIVAHVVPGN